MKLLIFVLWKCINKFLSTNITMYAYFAYEDLLLYFDQTL
jgi:hypothetical protein